MRHHLPSFNVWCIATGDHVWGWRNDVVACSRPRCRHTHPQGTKAILDGLSSAEGWALIAHELRHVEGQTTDDEPGAWE